MSSQTRRTKISILVALLILIGISTSPVSWTTGRSKAAVPHIFDQFTGPPSGDFDYAYATNKLAQSFTASDNYKITQIQLYIKDAGNDNSVSISLATSINNSPGNPLTYGYANGIDGFEWVTFELNTSVILFATALYWIVLNDDQGQQANGYQWAKRTDYSYPGGIAAQCSGSCQNWKLYNDTDYLFITYGIIGPAIEGDVEVSSTSAGRGDPLNYTVHFDNTGSEFASVVWINMSLSPHLTYVSDDSAIFGGISSSPSWKFLDVTLGPHLFHINVSVSMDVFDGTILKASFTLQYADRFGNMQEDHNFEAVSIARVPSISLSKSVIPSFARPGDNLTFTITFINSGSTSSELVWINDTLPWSVNYISDTAGSGNGPGNTSFIFNSKQINGNVLIYNFTNVMQGTYRLDINVTIKSNVLNGTEITNVVTLNFTDSSMRVNGPLWASTTARVTGASIRVQALALDNPVAPGDVLRFRVSYNNAGTASALKVWINNTLPQGVAYLNTSGLEPNYVPAESSFMRYTFVNVVQGPHSFIISVLVLQNITDGQTLLDSTCLNYTDWDSTLLEPSCSQTSSIVRIPNFQLTVQGPVAINPGDIVNYSLVVSNIGSGTSQYVWVRIQEAQDLFWYYDNTSKNGGVLVGPQIWEFTNVPTGDLHLGFSYKLRPGLQDGHTIVSSFELNYTDYKGRWLSKLQESLPTTVISPVIELEIIQDKSHAGRGETITYSILFNNTGNGTAVNVWINNTIPNETMFRRSSEQYIGSSGSMFTWLFTNVAPGEHNLTITVTVDSFATPGDTLTNYVALSYQDANGNFVGSRQTSISAQVIDGHVIPPDGIQTNTLWALVIGLLALLLVMWLFVAHKFYGLGVKNKAKIDELFLLHRSGELLRHHSRSLRPEVDSDVLSGMLVAVQNFVKESFNFRAGDLEELKFGDHKIILIHGNHVILAAVIGGAFPQRIVPSMRKALEEIEDRYGEGLEEWSGLTEDLPKIDDVLSNLFEENGG